MTFTKKDKKVIDSFIDKKPYDSKKFHTDGKVFDGSWLGGNELAYWKNGKIHFNGPYGKLSQKIANMIKKMAPKNFLGEDIKHVIKDIVKECISEGKIPTSAFASPSDQDPQIWIKIGRDASIGGYYRLEKDYWFRSWLGNSKGYGLMFREFKATTAHKEFKRGNENYATHKITFKYLPSGLTDQGDDVPKNWESSKGWLFILDELDVTSDDVKKFIYANMKKYVP